MRDKIAKNSLCGEKDETISQITRECSKLAPVEKNEITAKNEHSFSFTFNLRSKSKFGDLSRRWGEGSLFNSYHKEV